MYDQAMRVDVYHHNDDGDACQLNRIEHLLRAVLRQGATVMADLGTLQAEVAQNGDAVASAVTLLGGLAQQIRDLSTDPAAIQALADQLDSQTQALADAVVANTTPAPELTGITPAGTVEPPMVQPGVQSPATAVTNDSPTGDVEPGVQ